MTTDFRKFSVPVLKKKHNAYRLRWKPVLPKVKIILKTKYLDCNVFHMKTGVTDSK